MSTYTRLKVAAEVYAVPIGNVVEIASLGDLTAVPGAPRQILGVRNLRGQILPVIDLALLLGLTSAAPPRQLLVAEAGSVKAGFAIDEVSDVGRRPAQARPLCRRVPPSRPRTRQRAPDPGRQFVRAERFRYVLLHAEAEAA